jgi:hypothetical protein
MPLPRYSMMYLATRHVSPKHQLAPKIRCTYLFPLRRRCPTYLLLRPSPPTYFPVRAHLVLLATNFPALRPFFALLKNADPGGSSLVRSNTWNTDGIIGQSQAGQYGRHILLTTWHAPLCGYGVLTRHNCALLASSQPPRPYRGRYY